jgi:RNA polymerase sigma-70 factor (ECF subfamily)
VPLSCFSFEELCLPCYPELIAYAQRRTKNRAKAEDIVQESVLRALRAWDRWEPKGEPVIWARAWMFRIVSNVFSLQYQREKTFSSVTSQENAGVVTAELHQNTANEHPYQNIDTLGDEVRDALSRIHPEWAEVVKLVYVDSIHESEVAKMLKIPRGTVRSRMARGRLALARILSPFAKQRWGYVVDNVPSSD